MTKIVKKTRKIKLLNISFTLFLVMGTIFIFSTTLLRSYNVALSAKVSKMNDEIAKLSKEKETLQLEISELSSYNRVTAIVGNELSYDSGNFVTLVETNEEE